MCVLHFTKNKIELNIAFEVMSKPSSGYSIGHELML